MPGHRGTPGIRFSIPLPIGVIGTDQEIVIFRDGETYNVGLQPREGVAEPAARPASAAQPFMASHRGAPQ
jgi:hypothetical protein